METEHPEIAAVKAFAMAHLHELAKECLMLDSGAPLPASSRVRELLGLIRLGTTYGIRKAQEYVAWAAIQHAALAAAPPAIATIDTPTLLKAERERCAKVCEKLRDERFSEFGITEPDTGATYYGGRTAEEYEARDEEDEACAAAIRALPPR